MNAAELARALHGRKCGKGWEACCPAHPDKHPSMTINDGDDGKLLVHCQRGCTQDAVLDALKARGLWNNIPDPSPNYQERKRSNGTDHRPETALVHKQFGAPQQVYEYHNKDDRLVGVICRWDWPDRPKTISQAVPNGLGWTWEAMEPPRPLYGLPALLAEPTKPVLVVEGEKTAEAARQLVDLLVVTWAGGSSAVDKTDWTPLLKRDVTIWPDADKPGVEAASKIGRLIKDARIVDVSRFPEAWDLANWTGNDPDPAELIAKAETASSKAALTLPLKRFTMTVAKDYPPPIWAVPDLIPEGLTILGGSKARGKSFLCLDFALARAGGYQALGNIQCEPAPTLYLALEDTDSRLKERGLAILQRKPAPENLEIATEWRTAQNGGLDDIATWCRARPGAGLVIIDILARIRDAPTGRDKGVYQTEYEMIAAIKTVSINLRVPILVTHHTNKGDASDPVMKISGTQGLTGAADTIIVLNREANDPHGTLSIRGRDVPESEIAIEFDKDTGRAYKLGDADDFRRSEQEREILRTLAEYPAGATFREIAQALSTKPETMRIRLFRLHKSGKVAKFVDGKFGLFG